VCGPQHRLDLRGFRHIECGFILLRVRRPAFAPALILQKYGYPVGKDSSKAYFKENPDSVTATDESTGRLAVHDAVDEHDDDEDEDGEDRHVLLQLVSQEKLAFVLLSMNPRGTMEEDKMGRLPLHVAAAAAARTHVSSIYSPFAAQVLWKYDEYP
jgi:hypothetical protein